MTEKPSLESKIFSVSEDKQASMKDLLDYFAKQGRMRVSDLHLKVKCPPVYRVDGKLQKMDALPLDAATVEKAASVLLSDIELERLKADRAVDSSLFTETLQFRLNCFYDNDGLAVAIRALEQKAPPTEEIGFPNNVWKDIVVRQQGLVLLTGITGAGKSTTIASLIDRIAETRACRIITLEDPIEYRLESRRGILSQREVGRDVPTFKRGLRDCLREDPDIIFVGEMRDRESTKWTLTAAETGHLVFSTLHTRDTRGTITRVLDMFPANQQDEIASQLSLGLAYVISQKLIPRSDGKGRVVAMEILNNTYAVSNLIRLRKMEQVYTQLQTRVRDITNERMITMERCLAGLVASEKVAPLEAEKWADDRNSFLDEMKRAGQEIER
ncbi:MAG: PilT/PilU family type 4a pilus ATPase [Planctomycetota bacterium]|nr:PilT/PilU family type 4a pilus ATPase [Planctomycetota bacterium]